MQKEAGDRCSDGRAPSRASFFMLWRNLAQYDIGAVGDIAKNADNSFFSRGFFPTACEAENQNANCKEDYGVNQKLWCSMNRRQYGGHTKDKHNIEQVGADCISEGNTGSSLSCGHNRGDKFRQVSTDCYDCKSDEGFAHAERFCNQAGIVYN